MWPFAPKKCDHAADLAALKAQVRQLDADLDDLYDRMKRLTARKGMQARRDETRAGAMLPGEDAAAWKNRMRKAKQNGSLQIEEA